jgi:phosphonoacetaldehyde hydrolase
VIKIDNTIAGIHEGLNAGCWTVAVSKWAPYGGYTLSDSERENCRKNETTLSELSYQEIYKKTLLAEDTLKKSGAHFVIENISQIPQVITKIEDMINGDILIN